MTTEQASSSEWKHGKVLVTSKSFGAHGNYGKAFLKEQGVPEDCIVQDTAIFHSSHEPKERADGYSAVIAGTEPWPADTIRRLLPDLKIIARMGVGFDNVDVTFARDNGVEVTYTPTAPTEAVAEFTIAMMYTMLRDIPFALRTTTNRPLGYNLSEQKIGIIGCGRIGSEVAKRSYPALYRWHDPYVKSDDAIRLLGLRSGLDSLLSWADIVTLHVPLTVETYHMVNEEFLWTMKPGSYLINTSRGHVVDEQALHRYLIATKGNRHNGIALDVNEEEPYSGPLRDWPHRVYLTPHVAAMTATSRKNMEETAAWAVVQYLREGQIPKQGRTLFVPLYYPWPTYTP